MSKLKEYWFLIVFLATAVFQIGVVHSKLDSFATREETGKLSTALLGLTEQVKELRTDLRLTKFGRRLP